MIEVAKVGDILPGGMKLVKANGKEVVLCNVDGDYYVVDRRCGHMNAPLNMGTLDGYILTCPLHHMQFDVRTGEIIGIPVPHYEPPGAEKQTAAIDNYGSWLNDLFMHVSICDIKTYKALVEGDSIKADL
jgi:nitrite reductase/ring-hydroxylating ferredoxin subunit